MTHKQDLDLIADYLDVPLVAPDAIHELDAKEIAAALLEAGDRDSLEEYYGEAIAEIELELQTVRHKLHELSVALEAWLDVSGTDDERYDVLRHALQHWGD